MIDRRLIGQTLTEPILGLQLPRSEPDPKAMSQPRIGAPDRQLFIPDWLSTLVLMVATVLFLGGLLIAAFDLGPPWLLDVLIWSSLPVALAVLTVFAFDARHSGRSWFRSFPIGLREAFDFVSWIPQAA